MLLEKTSRTITSDFLDIFNASDTFIHENKPHIINEPLPKIKKRELNR